MNGKLRNYLPCACTLTETEKLSLLCKEVPDSSFWLRLDGTARDFFIDVLFNRI